MAGRNKREHRDGPEIHDAKADPTWTGGRLLQIGRIWTTSPIRFAGVVGDGMSTRSNGQHGKPVVMAESAWPTGVLDVWPRRVSEGSIVPWKPANTGGGKGLWFRGANEAAREGGD